MEPVTLHTTARRYLMSRNGKLHAEFAALPNDGRAFIFGDTREAKRIFPRYLVVEAMLDEVERLDPEQLPPVQQLAAALAAATSAQPEAMRSAGRTERKAMDAERQLFRESIKAWLTTTDLAVEPLGHRRVLSDEECIRWRRALEARWDLEGTWWHPVITDDVPDDVLVVHASAMWDGPGVQLVREALATMNRKRVIEIREPGDTGSLLDLDLFEPTYTGDEGGWTDETLDWVAYASHEQWVAFGGTLAERLTTSWPDIDDWRYVAPDWD